MSRTSLWSLVLLMSCSTKDASEPVDSFDIDESEDEVEVADSDDSDESGDSDDSSDSDDDSGPDYDEEDLAPGDCPDTWVLTYALEGRVDITHTPLDIGNAVVYVGGLESDELVIRVPDDGGVPANGQVQITEFNLLQDFTVSVDLLGEIALFTNLLSTVSDACGAATGELTGSVITWDECSYGSDHGTNNWSPDGSAAGPGCVNDYRVEGIVDCVDDSLLASCSDGWLDDGENVLDYVYNQPMLSLDFDSPDLERFTMEGREFGAELPTYTNNRTWLALDGELKSMSLEPTPACLCEE